MEDISVLGVVNFSLRRARLTFGGPIIIGMLAIGASIVRPDRYTVESRFKPEASDANPAQFASLASQFGFNLGIQSNSESPEFYVGLMESRAMLREVARTTFSFTTDQDMLSGTIEDLYEIEMPDDPEAVVVAMLVGMTNASVDVRQGVVVLRTTTKWPQLSVEIGARMLELVNDFNLEKRQSRAAAERKFVQQRLAEAQIELEAAEAELLEFFQHNRLYRDSPELAFESDRLQRIVNLREQVHNTLAQSFEQARIDEVRDTPVITIIDGPSDSLISNESNPILAGLMGIIGGGMLCWGIAIVVEYLSRQRAAASEEYVEFARLWRTTLPRLRSRRAADGD